MCRKKRLGLQRNEIFNQGIFLGWGVQSYLENCAYLWKNPGYAPVKWIKIMFSTYSINFGNCYLLNYPAITNIFAVNQIIRHNGVFAITKTPL